LEKDSYGRGILDLEEEQEGTIRKALCCDNLVDPYVGASAGLSFTSFVYLSATWLVALSSWVTVTQSEHLEKGRGTSGE